MSRLAILGGTPIRDVLPEYMKWPTGGCLEREALLRKLYSGNWTSLGEENTNFAKRYADYCQVKHALPVINGTVSIELIFRALEIGYGDEVVVPPYTFTASVHSIVMAGATPVFADIDPTTFTIDPESVVEKITSKTKAILVVHLGGRPADMDTLKALAQNHGVVIIEDAAHAHGSEWRGQRCGSIGKAGSFSFQASKNISCGEGGAITTNDTHLYERLWSMHNNGRPYNEKGYSHTILGTDARLAEWQCAILSARMERIDKDIETRMNAAKRLNDALRQVSYLEPLATDDRVTRNAYHLFPFRYHAEALDGLPRSVFLNALNAENVCVASDGYSMPIYRMKMLYTKDYQRMTGKIFLDPSKELPNNELIASKEGCWLTHSSLLGENQDTDRIIDALNRIGKQAYDLKLAFSKEDNVK